MAFIPDKEPSILPEVGKYEFNDIINIFTSDNAAYMSYDVNFTSNNKSYIAIGTIDNGELVFITNLDNGTGFFPPWEYDTAYRQSSSSWLNEEYKKINISDGILDADFAEWLDANAAPYADLDHTPTTPVAPKYLDSAGLKEVATKVKTYLTKKLQEVS